MAYFEFPHTRSYEGDLGYIIHKLKYLTERVELWFKYNSINYADPITWDISKQYRPNTVVYGGNGYAYISKKAVPSGIEISNPDYWMITGQIMYAVYDESNEHLDLMGADIEQLPVIDVHSIHNNTLFINESED